MKKALSILSLVLTLTMTAFALTACTGQSGESTSKSSPAETVTTAELAALESESDVTVSTSGAVKISLNGTTASVSGDGAQVKDSTVTVTAGGTYEISGKLTDGRILVDADGEEVTLILNNADITCSDSSAIYIYAAKSATVYLADGSKNTLTDGGSYAYGDSYSSEADEEPNACLYAKDDLVIAGSGSLTVNGNFNNGVTSKDTLKIEAVNLTVNAKNHGVNGKDSLTVKKAAVSVVSGGDALRATNDTDPTLGYVIVTGSTVTIESGEDGIQAETAVTMGSTTLNVKAGGGHTASLSDDASAKGIKAGTDLTVDSGTYGFDCADDALHANNNLTVNGGEFTVTTADDGLHADNTVTLNAGTFTIEAHEGVEGTIVKINDGTVTINASDDGINAAKKIDGVTPTVEINGGTVTVTMGQGDTDGIDSNGNIVINGGTVTVNAQSPFDYDGTGTINGGTVTVNGTQVTSLSNQFGGGMQGGGRGAQTPQDGQVPQDGQTPPDGQIPQGKHPSGGRGPRSQTTTTTEAETA